LHAGQRSGSARDESLTRQRYRQGVPNETEPTAALTSTSAVVAAVLVFVAALAMVLLVQVWQADDASVAEATPVTTAPAAIGR
jgi:hypothetical protein